MIRDERPVAQVPRPVIAALLLAGLLHLAFAPLIAPIATQATELPPAPDPRVIRLAGLGESAAAARIAMLYLQSADLSGGLEIPFQKFDYRRLTGWLDAVLRTDPRSAYPLFSAARIYAEVPDPDKMRLMLNFIREAFADDPNGRWPWLAHAALLAKHRLKDMDLARRYAAAIAQHTSDPRIPLWARQMEIFILEDMNELEAAEIMIGGLIETGKISDPGELRFLKARLEQLRARRQAQAARPSGR